jgi:glycosyltransferase involved in cell wall biosynthesis
VDVLHSLANTGASWGPFRRVVTIHDLIHRRHPEAHFGPRALGMRVLVPLAARRSHRVIVPSRHVRDDVMEMLHIPAGTVDVVPQGVRLSVASPSLSEAELRSRHDLGSRRIVLTTSAKRSHKNLMRLLEALALIPPDRRPILVLPGYPTPHESELEARAVSLGVASDVRFLGWVTDGELEALFRAAELFVFPSLDEGFGLPLLEAMARDVPVACSGGNPFPEVAGDAALVFDPESPDAIAAAIEKLLGDRTEAERLVGLGRQRVASFTWEMTARGTLAAYGAALDSAAARTSAYQSA